MGRAARLAVRSAAAGAIGISAVYLIRRSFSAELDALAEKLADSQTDHAVRDDLPPAVRALATRMGADPDSHVPFVDLRETGTMWFKPGGLPLPFIATQRIGTTRTGFLWRAVIGPLAALTVVDSFVAGSGLLEARLFGALRVARQDGTPALNQGETLRYLAEIPWNPDIVLFDHALEWTVIGPRTIKVATGVGSSRAEITFGLDDAGMIETASAASRSFGGDKRYPWHGRFWDYQSMGSHRIPLQGEVAWVIDGADFIYWRGKIESWRAGGVQAGCG